MREDALFYAYRHIERTDTREATDLQASMAADAYCDERARAMGYVKCGIRGCITLLAPGTMRLYCRFHERRMA